MEFLFFRILSACPVIEVHVYKISMGWYDLLSSPDWSKYDSIVGYKMDIIQQSACPVINLILVYIISYVFFQICMVLG